MSVFTRTEFDKLSVMYEGDRDRDATSKIRGFLFQDYVMIMCLLQNQVKYVCSEYPLMYSSLTGPLYRLVNKLLL